MFVSMLRAVASVRHLGLVGRVSDDINPFMEGYMKMKTMKLILNQWQLKGQYILRSCRVNISSNLQTLNIASCYPTHDLVCV